jgi:hypothetical protein
MQIYFFGKPDHFPVKVVFCIFFPRLFSKNENWTFLKMSKIENPKILLEKTENFSLSRKIKYILF